MFLLAFHRDSGSYRNYNSAEIGPWSWLILRKGSAQSGHLWSPTNKKKQKKNSINIWVCWQIADEVEVSGHQLKKAKMMKNNYLVISAGSAVDVEKHKAADSAAYLEIFAHVSDGLMGGRFVGVIRSCSRPS